MESQEFKVYCVTIRIRGGGGALDGTRSISFLKYRSQDVVQLGAGHIFLGKQPSFKLFFIASGSHLVRRLQELFEHGRLNEIWPSTYPCNLMS